MESPSFLCPTCGSEEWYKNNDLNIWYCTHKGKGKHTIDYVDLQVWSEYTFREYDELSISYIEWKHKADAKRKEGKAALIETVKVREYEERLDELGRLCSIAVLLKELTYSSNKGQFDSYESIELHIQWSRKG